MIDEAVLKNVLRALVENQKTQTVLHQSLLAEITALRETVRGLDPTFSENLKKCRAEIQASNAPTAQKASDAVQALLDAVNYSVFS